MLKVKNRPECQLQKQIGNFLAAFCLSNNTIAYFALGYTIVGFSPASKDPLKNLVDNLGGSFRTNEGAFKATGKNVVAALVAGYDEALKNHDYANPLVQLINDQINAALRSKAQQAGFNSVGNPGSVGSPVR